MEIDKRLIIIGDIHGTIQEFKELLSKLSYDKNSDRVILLGDLLDRGPDPVAVVRFSRSLNLECVMGNHELKFLKWLNGNKHNTPPDYYHDLSDEDIDYIKRMPYYIKVSDDLLIVHAGIKPWVPIESQPRDDLLFLRYTDKDRKFISLRKIAKGEAPDAIFWTKFGPFGTNVVYGHNVHSMDNIQIDKFDDGTACYGIDTGSCFGGNLTALIWDTKEVVQVKANKVYYKSMFDNSKEE